MIKIENVSMWQKGENKKIINNVSFSVGNGEVVGLIGENGSVLLKAIAGLKKINAGDIFVQGKSVKLRLNCDEKNIGYAFADLTDYDKFTVYEFLNFVANEHKIDPNLSQIDINCYIDMFKLNDVLNDCIKNLSVANRKRVFIIASIFFKPTEWILDSTFSGLSEEDKCVVCNLIKGQKQNGVAVILTSNKFEEIEYLCDKIAYLKGGEVAFFGAVDKAKEFLANL